MRSRRLSPELGALLPWLVASLIWLGLVVPMRTDQGSRLSQQSRIRRDRVKADRSLRDAQTLRVRIEKALATSCRASADPAALRQRTVAATAGLGLSPFTLSVNGGASGGAIVETEATRATVLELMRRLGDPGRGGFLRTVALRDKGARWTMSATTGVLDALPSGVAPVPSACAGVPDPGANNPPKSPLKAATPSVAPRPRSTPAPIKEAALPTPEPTPQAPFTLVAFLRSEGRSRVSLRVGEQVRVVAVGDQVEGWRCVSIDRDEGAVFVSSTGARIVLKAGSLDH